MKSFFICLAYTIVGFIISYGLYMISAVFIFGPLQEQHDDSPESFIGLAFMLILPICLAIGSFVIGYFCQPYIKKSFYYLLLCPGIYSAICVIAMSGGTIPGYFQFVLISSAIWIIASVLAVYIGKFFRTKKSLTTKLTRPAEKLAGRLF